MNTCGFRRLPGIVPARCLLAGLLVLVCMAPAGAASAEAVAVVPCPTGHCAFIPIVQSPDRCTVGWGFSDPANDVSAAYIDVTRLSSSAVGEVLTVVFKLRDVPPTLTFNRVGVPVNALEYSWSVLVDVDHNPATGFPYNAERGIDYQLSATHFVPAYSVPLILPIFDGVQVNTWKYTAGGWSFVAYAAMAVDLAGDTIQLTGTIPGLTADSRLIFETLDYNPGGARLIDYGICDD